MSLRAAIYARQSLDRSGEGSAVERQVADCRALAVARDWNVVDVITDNDVSASTGVHRPGYDRVLEHLRAGTVDRVVVWHVDRLTRRIRDLEEVVELCTASGVGIATVTGDLDLSTDTGRLLARILAAVARAEVERKGVRQRRANLQRAEEGRASWTRRPFAYDRDEHGGVVVVEAEALGLQRAAATVLAGSTLAAAVRELAAAGLHTSTGGPFTVTTLRRCLLNPRYAGTVTYNGAHVATGEWPIILTADQQSELAEVLRDPARRVQQGTALKYLLSGVARCGRDDEVMYATPMGTKARRWTSYRCPVCYLSRRQDLVDALVEDVVLGRLQRPDAAALFSPDVDLDALRGRAHELRGRRDALAAMLTEGLLSAQAVKTQAQKITSELQGLEDRVRAATSSSPASALIESTDVQATWDGLPLRVRRQVVELLLEVTILPAGKGARFDPSSVRITWRAEPGQ